MQNMSRKYIHETLRVENLRMGLEGRALRPPLVTAQINKVPTFKIIRQRMVLKLKGQADKSRRSSNM